MARSNIVSDFMARSVWLALMSFAADRPFSMNVPSLDEVIASVETMLAIAKHVGIDIDVLEVARHRLADHEAEYDAAEDWLARNEAEKLMAADIDELVDAFKKIARAVECGGAA